MVLLTAKDGGSGLTSSNYYTTSEGGPDIADLPSSYSKYGSGAVYEDMQNVLHEIGHSLLSLSNEHNVGTVQQPSGENDYYRTPMGHGGNASDDYCGNSTPADHDSGHELMYYNPDCTTDYFGHQ